MNKIALTEFAIQIIIKGLGAYSMLGALFLVKSKLEIKHKRIEFYIELLPHIDLTSEIDIVKEHYPGIIFKIYSYQTYLNQLNPNGE